MEAPQSNNLRKLAADLFTSLDEQQKFMDAVTAGAAARPAVIWLAEPPAKRPFPTGASVSWQPAFVDTVKSEARAGSHPLHESGAYYCLDLSSVFQIAVSRGVPFQPHSVLDVCSSPGGKSAYLWRLWQPEMLVANEVIGKRIGALSSNLQRCKIPGSIVSADVSKLAESWGNSFDFVLVDAPCSGQSLVARGMRAPACFHPATINMNSNRQKRLIANAGKAVRPGGYLAYTTCTFSFEENEAVVEWLLKKFPEFSSVAIESLEAYRSPFSANACYRLFPQQGEGAGGFSALLVKRAEEDSEELEQKPITFDTIRLVNRVKS